MLLLTCCLSVGEVIAEGQDGTRQHPLRHAIMAAIDAAAERDRRLWPSTGTQTRKNSAALSAACGPSLPSPSIASDDAIVESDLPGTRIEKVCGLGAAEVTFAACTLFVFGTAWLQDCQAALIVAVMAEACSAVSSLSA